jgi:hypothetical protein
MSMVTFMRYLFVLVLLSAGTAHAQDRARFGTSDRASPGFDRAIGAPAERAAVTPRGGAVSAPSGGDTGSSGDPGGRFESRGPEGRFAPPAGNADSTKKNRRNRRDMDCGRPLPGKERFAAREGAAGLLCDGR